MSETYTAIRFSDMGAVLGWDGYIWTMDAKDVKRYSTKADVMRACDGTEIAVLPYDQAVTRLEKQRLDFNNFIGWDFCE